MHESTIRTVIRCSLPSGESHPVADAYTVTIDLTTGDGVTQRVDSHVIRMENLYRWFTICE